MATRDFDPQRTAALDALDPIAFKLFSREWVCQPMPTPAAMAYVQGVTEAANTTQILHAGLAFVGAVVIEPDAWQEAVKGAVVDGDTLLELITWLATEYTARGNTMEEPPTTTITPPTGNVDQSALLKIVRSAGDIG